MFKREVEIIRSKLHKIHGIRATRNGKLKWIHTNHTISFSFNTSLSGREEAICNDDVA